MSGETRCFRVFLLSAINAAQDHSLAVCTSERPCLHAALRVQHYLKRKKGIKTETLHFRSFLLHHYTTASFLNELGSGAFFLLPSSVALSRLSSNGPFWRTCRFAAAATAALC